MVFGIAAIASFFLTYFLSMDESRQSADPAGRQAAMIEELEQLNDWMNTGKPASTNPHAIENSQRIAELERELAALQVSALAFKNSNNQGTRAPDLVTEIALLTAFVSLFAALVGLIAAIVSARQR